MSAKIIVLHAEDPAHPKHDVLQQDEYINIIHIDLQGFLSRAAGNVIYLDEEGKLYANNLCKGTNPDDPSTPSTPDQPGQQIIPKIGEGGFFPIGSPLPVPGDSGNPAGGQPPGGQPPGGSVNVGGVPNLGGGGGGGSSGSQPGAGGTTLPLAGGYLTGTPCEDCIGGSGECEAPEPCSSAAIIDGWQAQRSGRLGHNDLGEVQKTRDAAYAILVRDNPNLEQLEKTVDTDDTEIWAGGGYPPIFWSLHAITSGKKCDEQTLSNHHRKDRFWPIYSKKNAFLPHTIHTISGEGCAICLTRFASKDIDEEERKIIKVSGKEKAIHDEYEELHLYEMKQFACAINNPDDYRDWLTESDRYKESSFSSVAALIQHSKTRYAQVKGGGIEDEE